VTRLRKFEEAGPPLVRPKEQRVKMRLTGGRTGVRAVTCAGLELVGLTEPFDLEVFYGERVAVLGGNGSGKSHFLRLLAAGGPDGGRDGSAAVRPGGVAAAGDRDGGSAAEPVWYEGSYRLGARVVPGHFVQTHHRPDLAGRTLLEILWADCALDPQAAARALSRYELAPAREQRFETLSGGQQARLQILLLELSGATLLLLDEPTDNLDVASAEALEEGLAAYQGTVIAVTHDRWFARSFDRYVVFRGDGVVVESDAPIWDERRSAAARGRAVPGPG
jgi:ATPase subunit of ABC transporter with duplicated ATPase domains